MCGSTDVPDNEDWYKFITETPSNFFLPGSHLRGQYFAHLSRSHLSPHLFLALGNPILILSFFFVLLVDL